MFRTVGDQPSLWESILPEQVRRLPEELARVDALLDDPAFFAPFVAFFDPRLGRPSTPMETYLRLMFLKFRYRLGYESLCREVSDSITWRMFCRIGLDGSVPHPTTLMKLTTRCGSAAVDGLNEALLAKAVEAKVLRTNRLRADTTVVPANVAYPTDSGLLAKAIRRIATTSKRIQAAGGAVRTRVRELQGFFTERLTRQLQASPQTVAAYRDTMKLLVIFAARATAKAPSRLTIEDLGAATIGAFLSYLDDERHNSTATRNARLAAIHSFYRYALPLIPEHAHTVSQVLAIPQRHHDRAVVSYLTGSETDALLAAPDRTTWCGRRDHALLLMMAQTGLRVSEITSLTITDITMTTPGAAVHTAGKGRKQRLTPLTRQSAAVLRSWLPEAGPAPAGPVFPTRQATPMSADSVQRLVAKHVATAAITCPSLGSKHVTPHTLRHTAAMTLLHAGVDTSVIALWLGHESPVTTHIYLHADMTIKERALARIPENRTTPGATARPTTSSTSSNAYEYHDRKGRDYAARTAGGTAAEQHDHPTRHHDLGITAHLTIVFTALAVAHCIQERSGLAIANVIKQLRPLRSATITINGATQTFPPEIAEPQRKILTALGINMAY